jgi:hypothetical protein
MGIGSFPGKSGWGVALITHLHLALMLKKEHHTSTVFMAGGELYFYARKTYRLHSFLASALEEWLNFTPRSIYTRERNAVQHRRGGSVGLDITVKT